MKGEEGSHARAGVEVGLPLPVAFHRGLTTYF